MALQIHPYRHLMMAIGMAATWITLIDALQSELSVHLLVNFLGKLHKWQKKFRNIFILTNFSEFSIVSHGRYQHLIFWNTSGSSFLVCNATRFSQEVFPEHFKHSNFSSFVRQLNMYGFHKINKSPRGQRGNNENEIWEFSHPKFQRGRPDILEDINRKAMDSEILRRETGDIHASFAMVQLSQADLLQQFRVLQENFANLLQGFEVMKKVQLQQQIIIRRLAERQGHPTASPCEFLLLIVIILVSISSVDFLFIFLVHEYGSNNNQPSVFITSPPNACESLPHWNSQEHHQQKMQQDMMMPSSMHQNNQQAQHQQNFNFQMDNPLPPSPVSSILLP
jgi:hypothetical protein